MNTKIDKIESSLRPVHCFRHDVPKGLLSPLRKREQARFEQLKDEADEILRLADEWTSIPDHFAPMKLYSFMTISEQDAFWYRRYNDHKWEWLQHLHRRVPLPELFQLLDHQLQFQFIQVCKSYENSVNSKNDSSKWLMAVPEAKHRKAAALVKAREDFSPNYTRHSRVFRDSVTDYLQRPDAIPREGLADKIPIFKGIMSSTSGKASPRKGAWLPGNLQVNRVTFRTNTV